jgi:recombination protein RecA
MRLDIRRSGSAIKDKEGNVVGNTVKVKVVKNKLAPPFRIATFDIMYGQGISKVGEIVDLGSDLDVLKKSGSWFSFEGTKIAQGREAAKQFMLDNPEVATQIENLIKEKITGKPMSESSDELDTSSD